MSDPLDAAFDQFCESCADLGLPAWRVDSARCRWRAPDRGDWGPVASSERLIGAVASLAAAEEASQEPYLLRDFGPGVRFLLVRERVRRERFGWVATMLPSPGCGPTLATVCDAEPDAIESLLSESFVGQDVQTEGLVRLLLRVHQRAVGASENETALDDFTTQLTLAYESAVMTGNVARAMNRVDDPMTFLGGAVDELFASLPFGWVMLVRGPCAELARVMTPPAISRFDARRYEADALDGAAQTILHIYGDATSLCIEPCPFGLDESMGPELVVHPVIIDGSTRALLALGARAGDEWAVSSYDTLPISAVAAAIAVFLEIVLANNRQQESFVGTLRGLSRALDAKDTYTRGHSDRVAHVAARLASAAGLDAAGVRQVHIAGMVHDIGKIGVPESVLQGSGKLTDAEFALIKQHPRIGFEILQGIPMLADALPGVLHHHERWDGRGYPDGIAGEGIPLVARILCLADAFDAMSSNRKYQSRRARQEVLDEIRACAGSHFDPDLARRFLTLDFTEYDRMLAAEIEEPGDEDDLRGRAA